jgi:hypothetical protein
VKEKNERRIFSLAGPPSIANSTYYPLPSTRREHYREFSVNDSWSSYIANSANVHRLKEMAPYISWMSRRSELIYSSDG